MSIPEKAVKCLNLALNDSAPEGEWHAAAIRFCAILRKNGLDVATVLCGAPAPDRPAPRQWHWKGEAPTPSRRAPRAKKQAKPKAPTSMPFGKFKGSAFTELPDWYVDWCLDQDFVKDLLRAELAKVQAARTSQNSPT